MGRPCRRRGAADVQRSVPAAGPLGRRHPDVSARGCLEVVYSTSRGLASAIQESARSGAGQSAMTEFFAQHLIARLATVVMVAVELATTGVKRLLGHRRSEEHTSELQSRGQLVCRRLLENKNA